MVKKRLVPQPREPIKLKADFTKISGGTAPRQRRFDAPQYGHHSNLRRHGLISKSNQGVLIRELTHDWLLYHSTHAQPHQPISITLLLRKTQQHPQFQQFRQALLQAPGGWRDPHELPTLISECQNTQDNSTLNAWLTYYQEARNEAAAIKKSQTKFVHTKQKRFNLHTWGKWLAPLDAMVKRPHKRRFKNWWFSKRRINTTEHLTSSLKPHELRKNIDPRLKPRKDYFNRTCE